MKPSQRSEVPGFQVMSILAKIDSLRAQGRDVVSLTAGEPGSGAPPAVNRAAALIHAQDTVLNYSTALGIRPLREAVAAHCLDWYGAEVDADRIAITTGSSGAFMLSFLAAFDVGDRVALARPGYPAYRNILASLGIEVVDLDCGPEVRFQPTVALLEEAVAQGGPIAGLILASPANPTGTMIGREELDSLVGWCREREVQLISDEIYHGITYADAGAETGAAREASTGPPSPGVSALELTDEAVVVSSFSKYWGMPGWRLGWAVLPEHLVDPISRLAGNVSLCPPHGSQLAAVEAFSTESMAFAASQVEHYAAARQQVLDRLPELGWGEVAPADGAFYVYAHIGEHLAQFRDAPAYCQAVLEQAGVAIVPGTDFDPVAGHEWVRLSLAPGPEAVARGLDRIVAFHGG
ncbi:pyridoxal phosphate-dependent aminotransferase [Nesterenkonia sp. HG001]|uniref:pyridoxal phosphate-dependent aminotransferase n=1 Tax=Nesterenkonia sp. HG001 TaxID=2983207 RepID=UPI002AC7E445|nr:aminotransferase class I/II-fold pyridoxal phosphate-dependent enzyme [Nesterenkonia sp. HG001]MDZ5077607.1 aminotransferase class I/II-fold pyridoxal phosphate-dependent enzyme [Nesterenkonia sp. HG001]